MPRFVVVTIVVVYGLLEYSRSLAAATIDVGRVRWSYADGHPTSANHSAGWLHRVVVSRGGVRPPGCLPRRVNDVDQEGQGSELGARVLPAGALVGAGGRVDVPHSGAQPRSSAERLLDVSMPPLGVIMWTWLWVSLWVSVQLTAEKGEMERRRSTMPAGGAAGSASNGDGRGDRRPSVSASMEGSMSGTEWKRVSGNQVCVVVAAAACCWRCLIAAASSCECWGDV